MTNPLRLSLRLRLTALVLWTLVPAFALLIYHTIDDNRRATAEAKIAAQRLALSQSNDDTAAPGKTAGESNPASAARAAPRGKAVD